MKQMYRLVLVLGLLSWLGLPPNLMAQDADVLASGQRSFEARCGGCHGGDGKGGVRAPDIVTPGLVTQRSAEEMAALITDGLPDFGMPGFQVPEPELTALITFYRTQASPATDAVVSGDAAKGQAMFRRRCSGCHLRGDGMRMVGPDLSAIGSQRTLPELRAAVEAPDASIANGYAAVDVELADGKMLRGFSRNASNYDLQLQGLDGKLHLLLRTDYRDVKAVGKSLMPTLGLAESDVDNLLAYLAKLDGTQQQAAKKELPGALSFDQIIKPDEGQWPTYNGDIGGNRHSRLEQINTQNVSKLAPSWIFPIDAPRDLEMTPIVVDGVMYVTTSNKIQAIDAAQGREIWTYQRPRVTGVMGDAGSGANRGVAILGDKIFMATDNAHIIAVDRLSGRLLWDSEMADYREHYGGTLAPLVVKDKVIGGVGGGDEGIRGFLVAFDAETGEEAWRFWTVPLPGEPLSETWVGDVLPHGCGATWLTGTYDAELDTLYWPIGNPCPDMNGDGRVGDNLYTDSMLAFDPDTGKLKWHYQYTPHDEFDWDANQTPLLLDVEWEGKPRKVLAHANRNGYFYVLDRVTGELLRGKAFVENLTWSSGIGEDGRPILIPGKRPTPAGNIVCPGLAGATNWMSPAYHPETGLFYVQATEGCQIFTKREEPWKLGKQYFGGTAKNVPNKPPTKHLRALDLATGEIRWDVEQIGGRGTWAGVLSTDGGLVFYGDDSGAFAALQATDGEPLWNFQLNVQFRGSPMTYSVNGRQYVAIAAGRNVVTFALPR
jgi:PQQ-dependent dehydrogenase (methanol/ethanol family)